MARPAQPDMASGQLSGRSLDLGSNAEARGMVATPGEPGGQNSAYRLARAPRAPEVSRHEGYLAHRRPARRCDVDTSGSDHTVTCIVGARQA